MAVGAAATKRRSLMFKSTMNGKALWRTLSLAGFMAGAMAIGATASFAGECPADKMVANGQGQQDKGMAAKDVTDTVLASIDLSKEMIAASDHQFRMRRLEIKPGGIVPWHNHGDRPALIYVVQGEITEYASTCAVPIVHKTGDVSVDAGRSHWWKNTGKKTVVLISADILHDKMEQHMM
jgi:quercetin dioxygenase-like cupin family protein